MIDAGMYFCPMMSSICSESSTSLSAKYNVLSTYPRTQSNYYPLPYT